MNFYAFPHLNHTFIRLFFAKFVRYDVQYDEIDVISGSCEYDGHGL